LFEIPATPVWLTGIGDEREKGWRGFRTKPNMLVLVSTWVHFVVRIMKLIKYFKLNIMKYLLESLVPVKNKNLGKEITKETRKELKNLRVGEKAI